MRVPLLMREMFEHPLAGDGGIGVLAQRSQRGRFGGAVRCHRHERIDVAGRERDDARAGVTLGDIRRHQRVQRPAQRRVPLGAELAAHEIDHVGGVRKPRDRGTIEEIRRDRLHATVLEPLPGAFGP